MNGGWNGETISKQRQGQDRDKGKERWRKEMFVPVLRSLTGSSFPASPVLNF
jgi:hypothetical protein